jgi:hypothetical protein
VRHQQHGEPVFKGDFQQQVLQFHAREGVDGGEGLVEQQHARLREQAARDGGTLRLPAGELLRQGSGVVLQADFGQQARHERWVVTAEGDILRYRQPREQARLLEDEADVTADALQRFTA